MLDVNFLLSVSDKLKLRNVGEHNRIEVMRTVKGTGYHPQDPGAHIKNAGPPLCDNVVFFPRKFDTIFVGGDATRVLDALKKLYNDRHHSDFDGSKDVQKAVNIALDVEQSESSGVPVLAIHQTQWNDFLLAMELCGIGVSGAALDGSSV